MPTLRQSPRRHSRLRLATFSSLTWLARRLGGRRFYRWNSLSSERLILRREELGIPGLPAALDGLSVLQLSDLHAGPFLGGGDLEALVQWAQKSPPDLLVLTGDYITDEWSDLLTIVEDLGRIPHRMGAFAVLGNHDYRGRQQGRVIEALAQQGIECLLDQGRLVGGLPLWLSGLQDLEESRWTPERVRAGRGETPFAFRAGMPAEAWELVLCHHPLGAPVLAHERCLAVLSGHTHGRQIDLPFFRRLGPAHPGLQVPLRKGAQEAGTLYVNRGLGVVGHH